MCFNFFIVTFDIHLGIRQMGWQAKSRACNFYDKKLSFNFNFQKKQIAGTTFPALALSFTMFTFLTQDH